MLSTQCVVLFFELCRAEHRLQGTETRDHAMTGKGTPLKTSVFEHIS